ncbi:MAG: putative quinol monooxygenase [Bacteroidota bacterium]
MLIADVRFSIRPDAETAFSAAIGPFLDASREADGNLDFQLLSLSGEEHRYVLLERWETLEAFEAYLGSDAFAAFRTEVGPLLAGPPESAYYEARVADRETVR